MCMGTNPQVKRLTPIPYVSGEKENLLHSSLGPYRGAQPAFHNPDPVIFTHESKAPNSVLHLLSGALTPNKGILGTLGSKSHEYGKIQLVVYGNPKTRKPSSWEVFEWVETNKKHGETDAHVYAWKRLPTVKRALDNKIFPESYLEFIRWQKNE